MAITRAQRLKRVFTIDIETCPACGGAVRIAAPTHPAPAALVRPCTSSPALRIPWWSRRSSLTSMRKAAR